MSGGSENADDSGAAPRVDFYVLDGHLPDGIRRFACKITEKAYQLGHRVFVYTASTEDARTMDELLWTFRAGSFVPHDVYRPGTSATEPVLIGDATPPSDVRDVLVNLTASIPPFYTDFARIVELLGADPDQRRQARGRYASYRDHNCTLNTHKISGDR